MAKELHFNWSFTSLEGQKKRLNFTKSRKLNLLWQTGVVPFPMVLFGEELPKGQIVPVNGSTQFSPVSIEIQYTDIGSKLRCIVTVKMGSKEKHRRFFRSLCFVRMIDTVMHKVLNI